MSQIIGYARVSGPGQKLNAQVEALKAAGAVTVFQEKVSSAKREREQLIRAIAALEPGSTLLVSRLDRFARSTQDLLNRLEEIGAKGAFLRSLGDPWLDTSSMHGKLFLTIVSGIAEFERELIKVRTEEGRQCAVDRGVKMGRKFKLTPHQRAELVERFEAGDSIMDLSRTYGVTHPTVALVLARAGAR